MADQRSQGWRSAGSLEIVDAWKAETNDQRWGMGSPDQRHARGSSVKRMSTSKKASMTRLLKSAAGRGENR